ncbi:MAG: 50S ribosomal protein L15 [Prolixibacteraceae bacterium]|jgi:large subunit ribosomal protein L15|nr:50S ribosomal protein L15 [Prolixibacteraceae bacterium]HOO84412.1 50S ribosomal protein L15 [Prolixibacteraceae bacterium]HPR59466.1 50S ribosomal protein L15 [Prolixibacteraceae bacterium]
MDLSKLKPAEGATHSKKRIARGQGSGHGGTATRGHKGQKSRSGYSKKIGFEGGQMPIQRVVPKFGFKNFNRVEYKAINLKTLQSLVEKHNVTDIDLQFLAENGLISKNDKVKILGVGSLTAKLNVKAHAFSKSAKEAIEKLEGTTEVI